MDSKKIKDVPEIDKNHNFKSKIPHYNYPTTTNSITNTVQDTDLSSKSEKKKSKKSKTNQKGSKGTRKKQAEEEKARLLEELIKELGPNHNLKAKEINIELGRRIRESKLSNMDNNRNKEYNKQDQSINSTLNLDSLTNNEH